LEAVKRGEVWLARLDPTEGREIQKTRPCLIISPPEIHDYLDIVMVAPMTSGSHPAAYRVETLFNEKQNRILLEQVRTIDKSRLLRSLGAVDRRTLRAVLGTLQKMFAE
jgi:mRNA interferase MazF